MTPSRRSSRAGVGAAGLLAIVVAFIGVAPSSATPARSQVAVFFVQGAQLSRVTRPGATAPDALRRLIAGPTPEYDFAFVGMPVKVIAKS